MADNEIEVLFDNEQAGRKAAERLRVEYDRRRGVTEESEEVQACSLATGQIQLMVMAIYVIVRDNWKKLFPGDHHFLITLARMGHQSGSQAPPRIMAFWPMIKNRLGDERILPVADVDAQIALIGSVAWLINRASLECRPNRAALQRGVYEQIQSYLLITEQDCLPPMPEPRCNEDLPEELLVAAAEESDRLEHERIARIIAARTPKLAPVGVGDVSSVPAKAAAG